MSVATPTITANGQPLPLEWDIVSIHIWNEVNRIPSAELRILDGDFAQGTLAVSDAGLFDLGAPVEIKMRREGQKDPDYLLFKGIVVKQALEATPKGSHLVVCLKDNVIKLHGTRKSCVFNNLDDQTIINQLLNEANIQPGQHDIPHGGVFPQHSCMVQYDSTTWDFILLRAEALGLVVTVDCGIVSLKKPLQDAPMVRALNVGIDTVYDFQIETDALNSFDTVKSAGWDPLAVDTTARQDPGLQDIKLPEKNEFQALKFDSMLAAAVGRGTCELKHMVPEALGELKAWTNSRWIHSRLSKVRGRFSVPGNGEFKLLEHVNVTRAGKQFNSELCLTGIGHRIDVVDWDTELQVGFSPERHCEREDIGNVAAGGLVQAARGLQIGVVQAFENDPQNQLRVKVLLPGIDHQPTGAIWARLASPDAGANRGFFFRPEMGDEVVIGFLHDDPRHPVILGSLFGTKNIAPKALKPPSALNDSKGIITKKETKIIFDDGDQPSITIETLSKNQIIINDTTGSISLKCQNGNQIILDAKGITLDANKLPVTIKGAKVDIA